MIILRSLSAELLKLRRTLALWMVLVAPLIVVTLQFFVLYDRGKPTPGVEAWSMYIRSCSALWAIFMLPLYVTLETALLNNLEHSARSWKQLFALPVSRQSIVTAKLLMNFLLIGTSSLILCILVGLSAKSLSVLRPAFSFPGLPYFAIVQKAFLPFIASWLIIALHSWISTRWQGFALSLGIGIGAVFFAVFATSAKAGMYYPWLFPLNTLLDERRLPAVLIGSIGGILFSIFAVWDTTRRDVL
jgi:lantibiotic transport system permease protein